MIWTKPSAPARSSPPQTSGVPYDADATALKKRRDELKAEYDAIFPPAPVTEAERLAAATKAAERSLADWEARLALAQQGEFGTAKKEPGFTPDAHLKELRARRDTIRKEVEHLKDLANPGLTPEERAIRNRERQLERSEAHYRERLLKGDFAPHEKKSQPMSDKIYALNKRVEEAKKAFDAGRKEWLLKQAGMKGKLMKYGAGIDNFLRAIKTSFDASAVGVQNAPLVAAHPVLAEQAFVKMLKSAKSDYNAYLIDQELRDDPDWADAVISGLDMLDYESERPGKRPEEYKPSPAERIPGIKASERMYATFMNVLHLAVFKALKNSGAYGKAGPSKEDKKGIANFVNVFGGRGRMGKHQASTETLSHFIWSARLMVSRFQILTGQPVWGPNQTTWRHKGQMGKEYARSFVGMAAITLLMRLLFGDDDEDVKRMQNNVNSKLFGKVRIGNSTLDFTGGLSSYITFIFNIASATRVTMTGKEVDLKNSFGSSPASEVGRFMRGKAAPTLGQLVNLIDRQTFVGEPYTPYTREGALNMAKEIAAPLSISDVVEAFEKNGAAKGMLLTPFIVSGYGKSTFPIDYYKVKVNRYEAAKKSLKDAQTANERTAIRREHPYVAGDRGASIDNLVSDIKKREKIVKDLTGKADTASRQAITRHEETIAKLQARVISLIDR